MGKRGPKPINEAAMTGAARQARYRAKQAELAAEAQGSSPAPKVRYRKPSDRRSRPTRWRDAVAVLVSLQAEYQSWLDSLPESLAESNTAESLRALCDIDLTELEAVTPPKGFGRD
jgi:hypothetical protein